MHLEISTDGRENTLLEMIADFFDIVDTGKNSIPVGSDPTFFGQSQGRSIIEKCHSIIEKSLLII
jgi:hypothetical protein